MSEEDHNSYSAPVELILIGIASISSLSIVCSYISKSANPSPVPHKELMPRAPNKPNKQDKLVIGAIKLQRDPPGRKHLQILIIHQHHQHLRHNNLQPTLITQ